MSTHIPGMICWVQVPVPTLAKLQRVSANRGSRCTTVLPTTVYFGGNPAHVTCCHHKAEAGNAPCAYFLLHTVVSASSHIQGCMEFSMSAAATCKGAIFFHKVRAWTCDKIYGKRPFEKRFKQTLQRASNTN